MHIEVEQATQQVAANRGRKWFPDEIDWVLNKMQDRFIASCLRPREDGSGGFELDQHGTDKIRRLITPANLTAYVDPNDSTRYKSFLPANYLYLLNDRSYVVDLCSDSLSPVTIVAATHTQFITRLQQERSTLVAAPYYVNLVLQMPDVTITIPTDLPLGHTHTGYPEKADISFLIPWILNKGKILYWERYDDLYYPSHYIAVKTVAYAGAVAVTVDAIVNTTETVTTRILTYHSNTGKSINNRLTASNMVPTLNQTKYWKTAHYSPISELEGNNLIVHRDDSFIVTGTAISYIRKPQPISLSLNSDCELAGEATHKAVCDLATEYLKGTAQNVEGKQLKTDDIANRVIL